VAETAGLGLSRTSDQGEERLGSAAWCGIDGERQASLWYRAPGIAPVGFEFTDRLRPDAREVVAALRSAGLACEVLSGDVATEVVRIADAAGIDSYRARVQPAGKLEHLAAHAARGRKVLMVGDGLNDAPALAAAHASLSPVTAADISQATADVVFQGEALGPMIETIKVARETQRMALQNFAIALGYNAVFIPLAVVGLVTPLIAAIAMSASSVAVTANAIRLKGKKLQLAPQRTPS
jgi:Cu2+-exporting ATPase